MEHAEDRSRGRDRASRTPRRGRPRGRRATTSSRSSRSRGVDVVTGEGLDEALAGVDAHHRRGHRAVARRGRRPRSSSRPRRATCRTAGERAGVQRHRGRLDHRHRPVPRRLQAAKRRARAGAAGRPDPGAHPAGGAVPRVRRAARGVGPRGDVDLRAARCARSCRRPHGRRGARRPGRRRRRGAAAARRRSWRSPARARSASPSWRRCSPPGAARPAHRGPRPGRPGRDALEAGALLPGPGAMLAGPTFAEWLDAAVAGFMSPLPRCVTAYPRSRSAGEGFCLLSVLRVGGGVGLWRLVRQQGGAGWALGVFLGELDGG